MTLELLFLYLFIAIYRDNIAHLFMHKDEPIDDYQQDIMDSIVCDAPAIKPYLRVIK